MPPKQARGEATATLLLDAALAVYAKNGHAGFTVHAISASSGVSLGSLYHHFKSHEGLAAALYARCMAELLDGILAALDDAKTPRAGIAALVGAYLDFVVAHPEKARFLYEAAYAGFGAEGIAAIAASKGPRLERILSWMRPHVRAGAVVELPEPLLEILVIGPVAELSRRWIAGAPNLDLEEAARVLPERIWRSLARPTR